jgi:hypothetical protein
MIKTRRGKSLDRLTGGGAVSVVDVIGGSAPAKR